MSNKNLLKYTLSCTIICCVSRHFTRYLIFEIYIHFVGGCQGNTTGVAALAKGLPIDEVIDKLSGIQCGFRGTSCPDQLSKALIAYKENN